MSPRPRLGTLVREAEADGRRPVVGALILDRRGRVFVQRRGAERAFLTNGWDLVGGHVEAGETLLEALRREVTEETRWTVVGQPQLAFVGDWRTDPDDLGDGRGCRPQRLSLGAVSAGGMQHEPLPVHGCERLVTHGRSAGRVRPEVTVKPPPAADTSSMRLPNGSDV